MYCPRCGSPNEQTAKFCIKCGERFPASGQPEPKPPAPTPPRDTQQRQGPSKAKGRSKLVIVILAVILVLLLILAVELVLLLTGRAEKTPTPAAIATLPATAGTPGASSPSSAVASSPSATVTPLPPTVEPTQPAESEEVQPTSDLPTLVLSARIGSFAIASGRVFAESGDNEIHAFDITTGQTLWAASAGGKVLGADPDLVYAGPADLRVDALDASTGEFRWRFLSQEPAPPLTASSSFVLLAGESVWYVLDKSSGNVVSTSAGEEVGELLGLGSHSFVAGSKYGRLSDNGQLEILRSDVDTPMFCDDVFVYRADPSGGLEAIDEATGSPLWNAQGQFGVLTFHFNSVFLSAPFFFPAKWGNGDFLPHWNRDRGVCGAEALYVYEGSALVAFSKATGELLWRGLDLTQNNWVGEADDMAIYSKGSYGWTQAYDATDHSLIWENPHVVLGEVVGVVDDIVVGTEQNPDSHALGFEPRAIVGLDAETGETLWRHEPGTMVSVQLMQEQVSYVLERGSGIWFIDPRTGEVMVQIPFHRGQNHNQFFAANGMIIAVNRSQELVVIRP